MTAPRRYTLADAGAVVGLSADRFRKVWKWWVEHEAFPHPLKHPGMVRGRMDRTPYSWDADACDAWAAARSTAGLRAPAVPPTSAANDVHPFDRPDYDRRAPVVRPAAQARRLAQQRAELSQLMTQGRKAVFQQ